MSATMRTSDGDDRLWADLVAAEETLRTARLALVHGAGDLTGLLGRAIAGVTHRGVALRLLLLLPEEQSRLLFPELVAQASVGHADIGLVRTVILRMDAGWVISRIDAVAAPLLERGDEEEHRRFAELYRELDPVLLAKHLERVSRHPNPEVRDVVADYPNVRFGE